MTDSAVLAEQVSDVEAAPPIPARPGRRPIPVRKQRRFRANLRFNALRYLVLSGSLLSAWGLLRASMWRDTGTPESTFLLALAGGLLAAAAKTGIDILSWAESNRQAVHVERVHAVQRLFQRACTVREHAILDWRRIHTILMDSLSGQSQEIRLFRDHDETDRQSETLFQRALSEEMWIRREGVDAVRRFKARIAALDYDAIATEEGFLSEFNALMDALRRELALAAIGIPLE